MHSTGFKLLFCKILERRNYSLGAVKQMAEAWLH